MLNEKLILELTKYILDAYKGSVPLNEDYVYALGDIIINNLDLNNYVKNIQFRNLDEKALGRYVSSKKVINYDLRAVISLLSSVKNINLSYDSKKLYYYISALEFLAHELEHANQYKKINKPDIDLENKILTSSLLFKNAWNNDLFYNMALEILGKDKLKNFLQDKNKIYMDNWSIAPEEKLANYYAGSLILKILNNFNQYEDLIKFKRFIFLKYLMDGYDTTLNPTKVYLEKIKANLLTEKEINGEGLTLIRRLSLGLRISDKERNELNNLSVEMPRDVYHY